MGSADVSGQQFEFAVGCLESQAEASDHRSVLEIGSGIAALEQVAGNAPEEFLPLGWSSRASEVALKEGALILGGEDRTYRRLLFTEHFRFSCVLCEKRQGSAGSVMR